MFFSNRIFVFFFFLSLSNFAKANSDEPQPGDRESQKAYQDLNKKLINRFQLPSRGDDVSVEIPSLDCHIKLRRQENVILLHLKRGSENAYFSVRPSDAVRLNDGVDGYKVDRYTRDCEEMGCDGYWYIDNQIFVGEKIIQVTSWSAYSHTRTDNSCILK